MVLVIFVMSFVALGKVVSLLILCVALSYIYLDYHGFVHHVGNHSTNNILFFDNLVHKISLSVNRLVSRSAVADSLISRLADEL